MVGEKIREREILTKEIIIERRIKLIMAFRLHTRIPDSMDEDRVFQMGGQCNYVDYTDDFFCAFRREDYETRTQTLLMLVPYENILYIERIEEG